MSTFLSTFAPRSFESAASEIAPWAPQAAFELSLSRFAPTRRGFGGNSAAPRFNAALLAARRGWPALSTQEKALLLPLMRPPLPEGIFLNGGYEIRFPSDFGASRVAQIAVEIEGVRNAFAENFPSLVPRNESDEAILPPSRVALISFPPNPAIRGYAVPFENGAWAVLDSRLNGAALSEELAYQATYALLLAAVPDADPWLLESSALLSLRRMGFDGYVSRIEPPTAETFAAGVGSRLLSAPADPSFAFYLAEIGGAAMVDAVWSGVKNGLPLHDAITAALGGAGLDVNETLAAFSLWTLHRGERGTAETFPEGVRWPDVAFSGSAPRAPAAFTENGAATAQWGIRFYEVGDGTSPRDAVRMSFDGRGGRFGAQAMLWRGARPVSSAADEWVSFGVDAEGRGAINIPRRDAARMFAAVILLEANENEFPMFKISVDAVADYPVKMGASSATLRGDGVELRWTTLSEKNVFGWRIIRRMPTGHEFIVTALPLPSPGESDTPMHYGFIDDISPRFNGRYTYFAEALTGDGLAERVEIGGADVSADLPAGHRRFFLRQ